MEHKQSNKLTKPRQIPNASEVGMDPELGRINLDPAGLNLDQSTNCRLVL